MTRPFARLKAPRPGKVRSTSRTAGFLLWPVFASAAAADCPGQTQVELNRCAHDAYLAADAELNAVWPVAKASMDQIGAGAALLDAQRKWIAFRDAACAAEAAPYDGGSIRPQVHATCLERLTRRRTEDLRMLQF